MKRYKFLVFVIACMGTLAFTACASLLPEAPLRTPMPTPPAIYEEASDVADDEIHDAPPADLPAPQYEDNPLTVAVANDDLLDGYFYYVRHEEYGQGEQWVIFTTDRPVSDFAYIAIGLNMDEMYFYEADVVYALAEILPGVPFVVNWQDSEGLPHRGVRFAGADGIARYFYVGLDGDTVILEEFWPGVRVVAG